MRPTRKAAWSANAAAHGAAEALRQRKGEGKRFRVARAYWLDRSKCEEPMSLPSFLREGNLTRLDPNSGAFLAPRQSEVTPFRTQKDFAAADTCAENGPCPQCYTALMPGLKRRVGYPGLGAEKTRPRSYAVVTRCYTHSFRGGALQKYTPRGPRAPGTYYATEGRILLLRDVLMVSRVVKNKTLGSPGR